MADCDAALLLRPTDCEHIRIKPFLLTCPPQLTQVFSIHYSLHLATSMKTQRVPSLRDCKTEPLLVCSP